MSEEQEQKTTRFLKFEDLAARLPFSKSTLRRRIRDGSIAKYQPGGRGSRLAFHPDLLKAATAMVNAPDPESAPGASAAPLDPLPAVPTPVRSKLPGPTPKWLERIPRSTTNKKE